MEDKKTVKVEYHFATKVTCFGIMEVPEDLWCGANPEEDWTEEVEKYIYENHNDVKQPPEFEDYDDWNTDFYTVDVTE